MSRDISNNENVVDSRDIISRIEELRDEISAEAEVDDKEAEILNEWLDDQETEYPEFPEGSPTLTGAIRELCDEYRILKELESEAEGYASDWKFGETLIRDTYWVEYCEELCKDIGDLPKKIPAYIEIDWEKTAENIKADYTELDWDGAKYYIRCS
jgi:hypothetical protein